MTTARGRVLLAAENNGPHRLVLRRMMAEVERQDGIALDLRFVGNGLELLDWIAGEDEARPRPDLILLDLHMPGLDGFGTLRRLRGDEATRATPVIILSSSDEPGDVDEAYALGANAYLVKHGDSHALLAQMRRFAAFWAEAAQLPRGGA